MTAGDHRRILVVEDDAGTRGALQILFSRAGYEVGTACNGSDGFRLWRDSGADLVIVDMFMPDQDGIETIIALRAYSPGTPILAMSGGGDRKRVDVLEDAKLLGALLTIKKPFASDEMLAMVSRALHNR